MKPDNWQNVPYTLLESLLWDMGLDYDPYEGSREETIAGILNGNISCTNERMVGTYWKAISEEEFHRRADSMIESLQSQIEELTNLRKAV
jgi:hypothetical protein